MPKPTIATNNATPEPSSTGLESGSPTTRGATVVELTVELVGGSMVSVLWLTSMAARYLCLEAGALVEHEHMAMPRQHVAQMQ